MSEQRVYDVVVIGCGPAGLSAAVNVKIRNRDVVVLGTEVCSPPLNKAPRIVNYLGFASIPGVNLRDKFVEHAAILGIHIKRDRVQAITAEKHRFLITTRTEMIPAKTVILATGAPYRPRLAGEAEFLGRGLSYCATCDGPLYQGKDIVIIGHSPEAETEASYMAEICRRVRLIPLYGEPKHLDQNVEVVTGRPVRVIGDGKVTGLEMEGTTLQTDGVFIIGAETPPESLFPGIKMQGNHISVNRDMQTSIPGLFAAGDCTGPPYQVAKAVGEGQVAGLSAAKWVVNMRQPLVKH